MKKTKEEMAQEYADRYLKGIQYADPSDYEFYCDVLKSIYLDGYTACEQSIWHSIIEEEYPEENKTALCRHDDGEFIVAILDHIDVYNDEDGGLYSVPEWWVENECGSYTLGSEITHWMPIPPFPDTNTEKQ